MISVRALINIVDFHLLANDANLFYKANNPLALETTVNCDKCLHLALR